MNEQASEKELGLSMCCPGQKGEHLIRAGMSVPDWTWQTYHDLGNRQGTYQFASLARLSMPGDHLRLRSS